MSALPEGVSHLAANNSDHRWVTCQQYSYALLQLAAGDNAATLNPSTPAPYYYDIIAVDETSTFKHDIPANSTNSSHYAALLAPHAATDPSHHQHGLVLVDNAANLQIHEQPCAGRSSNNIVNARTPCGPVLSWTPLPNSTNTILSEDLITGIITTNASDFNYTTDAQITTTLVTPQHAAQAAAAAAMHNYTNSSPELRAAAVGLDDNIDDDGHLPRHDLHDEVQRKGAGLTISHTPDCTNASHTNTKKSQQRPVLRKGTVHYREFHIFSERQRRQDMRTLFATLKSLLPLAPNIDNKMDRCSVLGLVIDYVHSLKAKLQDLAQMKDQLQLQLEGSARRSYQLCHASSNFGYNSLASKCMVQKWDNALSNTVNTRKQTWLDNKTPPSIHPHPTFHVSVRMWGKADIFINVKCPKVQGLWSDLLSTLADQAYYNIDVVTVTFSTIADSVVHCIYAKVIDFSTISCEELKSFLIWFLSNRLCLGGPKAPHLT